MGGLLPEQGVGCKQWSHFVEFLWFPRSALVLAPELHDASLYWFQSSEDLLDNGTSELAHIGPMLDNLAMRLWLQVIQDVAASDSIGKRALWIWRSV